MRPIVFVLVVFALVIPAARAHADAPVAPVTPIGAPTPIAAYGGWLAWSEHPAGSSTAYRLVLRSPDGVVSRPPIPTRSISFDVDLGPSANGGVVAAYSRCTTEARQSASPTPSDYGAGRGCAPYLLDIATGVERRVVTADAPDASEVWPSPWRGALAFERVYASKPSYPYLYVGRSDRAARSVREPGGARQVCARDRRTGRSTCSDATRSRAAGLELYGRRFAFGWSYQGLSEGRTSEIRLDTLGGGHELVAHQAGGGLTQVELGWPALVGSTLSWARECYGDPGGCPGRYGLQRRAIAGGATNGTTTSEPLILSHDADAGASYVLLDSGYGVCQADPPGPEPTCVLAAATAAAAPRAPVRARAGRRSSRGSARR